MAVVFEKERCVLDMIMQYGRITSQDKFCGWREVNDVGWKLWLKLWSLEQVSVERTCKWPVNVGLIFTTTWIFLKLLLDRKQVCAKCLCHQQCVG